MDRIGSGGIWSGEGGNDLSENVFRLVQKVHVQFLKTAHLLITILFNTRQYRKVVTLVEIVFDKGSKDYL